MADRTQIEAMYAELSSAGYIPSREIAVACLLMDALEKPLLVEGPAGVGKTELAKALSKVWNRTLIRLQCFEGLDESRALYEWEYGKQLLYTEMLRPLVSQLIQSETSLEGAVGRLAGQASALFSESFLLERPLLQALRSPSPALLLVDEIDRADPEFEALLLEVLGDFQASIPELGTLRCRHKPRVVLTSNGTRELTDALRRRCLFLHLGYPEPSREHAIVSHHLPTIDDRLTRQVVQFVARARTLDLRKAPSVAETVDWAKTLVLLSADSLEPAFVEESLSALAKHPEDQARLLTLSSTESEAAPKTRPASDD